MSMENEAKKLAATYARWLRKPEDALFGKQGRGVVMIMYEKLKNAKTIDEIKNILDLHQYESIMDKMTYNDLQRFINDLQTKISGMSDEQAKNFVVEVFRYFQISLYTKIEDINKGIWG
ncbi:hypothetical protein [Stygiolobus caldivivus]|uniref:Uncharacterized protein n=1 Tax=Stygiolobus caldivivus TaxID=2824673 RepID=A0A8D5U471_9CREN|nr:hypothetical protein [Stygiolobus caldivivus]BCU69130.1 hypothetical protein KN1_04270 [Stygiolobus caldivivus]